MFFHCMSVEFVKMVNFVSKRDSSTDAFGEEFLFERGVCQAEYQFLRNENQKMLRRIKTCPYISPNNVMRVLRYADHT